MSKDSQDKNCPFPSSSVRSYFLTKESILPGEGAAKPSDTKLACSNFILFQGCEFQHVLNLPMHSERAASRLGRWFK